MSPAQQVLSTEPVDARRETAVRKPFDIALAISGERHLLRHPVYAVGFHGALCPGAVCIVTHIDRADELERMFTEDTVLFPKTSNAAGWTFPLRGGVNYMDAGDGVVLYPGDVHVFGSILPGLGAMVVQPGFASSGQSSPFGESGISASGMLRIYSHENQRPPGKLNYLRRSASTSLAPQAAAPTHDPFAGNASGGSCVLPQGASQLTLVMTKNDWDAVPTVTEDIEVWWHMRELFATAEGWVHHDADDLDAAGRGQSSATHYTEVYDLPSGVDAIYIRQPSIVGVGQKCFVLIE